MNSINEAMIFAAGFGKRMLPLTKKTPKPLLKINNKSIISYQIERLIELNFKNILINGHHLFQQLESELEFYRPYVKIIYEKEILETGGGLLNLIKKGKFKNIRSPKLLINGDVFWRSKKFCPIEMIIKNWKKKMDLLLLLKKKEEVLGYRGKGDFSFEDKNKKISRIIRCDENNNFMFTGLQIINPSIIQNREEKFSLRDIFFESIIKKKIYGLIDENDWFHISNVNDLRRVNQIF